MVKFPGILQSLGLSRYADEKLFVKIEVDTNPPKGGEVVDALVSRDFIFSVSHYDIPSLFSAKLHVCFYRKFTKGRDVYDLNWYLGRNELPNLTTP